MPVPLFNNVLVQGIDSIPFVYPILKAIPWVILTWIMKWYFGGASNSSERMMHSKVVMVTVNQLYETLKYCLTRSRVERPASAQQSFSILQAEELK